MSIEDFISIFESIMMPEAIPTYISKDSLMFYPTEETEFVRIILPEN